MGNWRNMSITLTNFLMQLYLLPYNTVFEGFSQKNEIAILFNDSFWLNAGEVISFDVGSEGVHSNSYSYSYIIPGHFPAGLTSW